MKEKVDLHIKLNCLVDNDPILEAGTFPVEDLIKIIGKDKELVITKTIYNQYSDKPPMIECEIKELYIMTNNNPQRGRTTGEEMKERIKAFFCKHQFKTTQ